MNARGAVATFGEFARNGLGVPVLVMVVLGVGCVSSRNASIETSAPVAPTPSMRRSSRTPGAA